MISLDFKPSVAVYALLLTEMDSVEVAVEYITEVVDDNQERISHVWHTFLASDKENL